MGRACSMNGEDEKCIYWMENQKEDQYIGGLIISVVDIATGYRLDD
jgi:hypothetical protein